MPHATSPTRLSPAGALTLACAAAMLALPAAPARAQEHPPIASICGLGPHASATTCQYTANEKGLPISARTEFPDDFDQTNADPLNTAEHELFHAIGFSTAYAKFAGKLIPTPGAGSNGIPAGSRSYSKDGTAGGILMTLVPAAGGAHSDPDADGMAPWPATGYDQGSDIMQPGQVVGSRLNDHDAAVLNDVFGWGKSGIHIDIVNVLDTLDGADLALLSSAAAALQAFYPNNADSPIFTWYVAEVTPGPEPATWGMMLCGFGLVGGTMRARRQRAACA